MLYFSPGDPTSLLLPHDTAPEQREAFRHDLGLDRPFWVQYGTYMWNIITKLDFGRSWVTLQSVSVELFQKFPYSVKLAFFCALIATILGIIFGLISAVKQYSIYDNITNILGLVIYSMPAFWLAMILIVLFSVKLKWLPPSGVNTWRGWVLPCCALGLSNTARVMRMTRSSMLEVMRQDYITTARAKGLREYVVIWRHALGNAFIPILTVIGITFGQTLSGGIVTEQVYSIPGIGKLVVDSVNQRNFPMVQGVVLLCAVWMCLVNLAVDLIYAFIDPRIKAQYRRTKNKIVVAKEGAA
jgi:peptide/nickel transport system permease protein